MTIIIVYLIYIYLCIVFISSLFFSVSFSFSYFSLSLHFALYLFFFSVSFSFSLSLSLFLSFLDLSLSPVMTSAQLPKPQHIGHCSSPFVRAQFSSIRIAHPMKFVSFLLGRLFLGWTYLYTVPFARTKPQIIGH